MRESFSLKCYIMIASIAKSGTNGSRRLNLISGGKVSDQTPPGGQCARLTAQPHFTGQVTSGSEFRLPVPGPASGEEAAPPPCKKAFFICNKFQNFTAWKFKLLRRGSRKEFI